MSVEGVRDNHDFQIRDRRCDNDGANCGSRPTINVHGNTIETPRYKITASDTDHGTIKVLDKLTGKVTSVGGDPHLRTSDGDYTSFQKGNLTLNLDDGTKITFDPTKINKDGVSYIDRAVITNGAYAAVVNFDGGGNPTTRELPRGAGYWTDFRTPDGVDLFSKHGSLDDLTVGRRGPEIKGHDIVNLDDYRHSFGESRPSLPARPHIGLPNWSANGPFSGWPQHAFGPHHQPENSGPDGRYENRQLRNLVDQLHKAQWRAHQGPQWLRHRALREVRQLEEQLRDLRAHVNWA